ncbi:hypothetical protein [Desmospora profundinema]|uniref:Uncharacterized protein n=1 Tax=Desmospora profundinema TaxID=1571184 RepID=A0ABU1IRT5_9BACL|nr:hypothetical protein [Desmospora profundinema]MDR6227460.1 hypothetical protein [Desmospora profundinema]
MRVIKGTVWLLLFSLLTACVSTQAVPSVSGVELKHEKVEEFQPYQDSSVPNLQNLITRPGFRQYTSQKPYLLGYSHDGAYLATIVFEKKANAYRIDIFHVGNNSLVDTVYAPVDIGRMENGDSTEAEMLQTTQETLDWGYRIKVPVRPHETPIHHQIRTGGEESWIFHLKQEDGGISLTAEGKEERWQVHHYPLRDGERIRPQWAVASFPETDRGPWSLVVATYRPDRGLTAMVQSVDVEKLAPAWSEAQLKKRIREGLGEEAQIVYRGHLTDDGPDLVLAVLGSEKRDVSIVNGVHYQGTVSQFILLDADGTVYFRGNAAGLVENEQVRVDSHLPWDESGRFRLMLNEKETGDGKRRLLTIDQINGEGRLARTYEFQWSPESGRFERIKPNR